MQCLDQASAQLTELPAREFAIIARESSYSGLIVGVQRGWSQAEKDLQAPDSIRSLTPAVMRRILATAGELFDRIETIGSD